MKQSILLLLVISIYAPVFGMNHENEPTSCDRCGLGTIVYNITKRVGRNDFLYLAHANSMWFFHKKLQSKEHFEDRDNYYMRFGRIINNTDLSLFHTPLHEAIKEGNIEIVKLLCSVGVDAHKKIKSAQEITQEDNTTEQHPAICMTTWNEDGTAIQEFKDRYHIGLSALELATLMRTKSADKVSERAEIEQLLIGHAKKS